EHRRSRRHRQAGGLHVARRGGQVPEDLRPAQGRPRGHAGPRCHRRAAGRVGAGHPAAAVPGPAAQVLRRRSGAGRGHVDARRQRRGAGHVGHVGSRPRRRASRLGRLRGRHRAGPAHGLGRLHRRAAAPRAGPGRHRGGAGGPAGHGPPIRGPPRLRARCLPDRGRLLVGHLRPQPGRRPGDRPGRWRPPPTATAVGGGRLHGRRGHPARRCRPALRASAGRGRRPPARSGRRSRHGRGGELRQGPRRGVAGRRSVGGARRRGRPAGGLRADSRRPDQAVRRPGACRDL
ncbi:MAG: tRNA pseudouridine(55) synthase, partial [uncultured Acidimicrobiales bacterium]